MEQRLRAAVESSPVGLLMIDSDGKIVLVNREIERLFGYDREELLGRSVEMLVPERFRGEHPGYRQGFFANPKVRSMGHGRDLYGLHKDGSETPVEIGLTPVVTPEGLFVISSIIDISARKALEFERSQLEEQLRQAQKLDAVGRLAGGIAHDFNNILGAIIGYSELAREARTAEERDADLGQVLRAGTRGKELVERILRFSRPQARSPRPSDLSQVVKEATGLLRATLPATIDIRIDCPETVPRVMADVSSIHQVIMNLGTNSAHAMPAGGKLSFELERFYVRDSFARANPGLSEGEYVRLAVRDSGSGMDETTRARAFEPFFTTKEPGEGTGLGLSMVHGILQSHKGLVWIESEKGAGTTVNCILPALEDSPAEAAAAEEAVVGGNGERILYIDDELDLAELGQRRLERLNYRVEPVVAPEEAIGLMQADPLAFDLVITDFAMPKINGIELARALTGLRPGLPIIMLTGYMDDFPKDVLKQAGMPQVLKKPVTTATLAKAIRRALDKK